MLRKAILPRAILVIMLTSAYFASVIVRRRKNASLRTRESNLHTSLGLNIIAGPGGVLEQLFAVISSSPRIPLAFQYEREVTKVLRGLRGKIFLDIGAYRGFYSSLVSNNFRRVVAIEPDHENVRIMRRVFRLASIDPEITESAISSSDGITVLYAPSDSAGHQISEVEGKHASHGLRIPTQSIASLVKKYGDIDVAKVDVEGAEWLVLKGAESVTQHLSRWIIELHDLGRRKELENWMLDHGYQFSWLDSTHLYSWRR